jgi:ketosteroid isomerase-like protein
MNTLLKAAFCFVFLGAVAAAQRDTMPGSMARRIWSQEEAYWKYVESHDLQHYLSLWSEDFVGWPMVNDQPIHKSQIASQFQTGRLSRVTRYELHRESVDMHGPIGVTFYRVKMHIRGADGKDTTTAARITHTWMNDGYGWHIVSGMSAADSTASPPK